MEKIASVQMLNGQSAKDRSLNKSDFKTGDSVTIRYRNKDFRGTVDFGKDKDIQNRGESPCSTPSFPDQALAQPRVKRRHRSLEGVEKLQQTKKTCVKAASRRDISKSKGISRKPRGPGTCTCRFTALHNHNGQVCMHIYMYVWPGHGDMLICMRTYIHAIAVLCLATI